MNSFLRAANFFGFVPNLLVGLDLKDDFLHARRARALGSLAFLWLSVLMFFDFLGFGSSDSPSSHSSRALEYWLVEAKGLGGASMLARMVAKT